MHLLLDTGPLVALLCSDDSFHDWATDVLRQHDGELFCCDAVYSEANFLIRRARKSVQPLTSVLRNTNIWHINFSSERGALADLMDRYANVPMSYADACLVRATEINNKLTILSMDSGFDIYRKNGRQKIPLIGPK